MFLRFKTEGVNVDAGRGNIFVVLIRLYKVEISPIPLREPIMSIELEFGEGDRVLSILERNGDENVVSTTSSNTGHGTSIGITRVNERNVGSSPSTSGSKGSINKISVVKPLLSIISISDI
jgi:hypothetical protein